MIPSAVASAVIGLTFVYSAVGILANLRRFHETLLRYQILPRTVVAWVAPTVPAIEALLGSMLLAHIFARAAATSAAAVLCIFTAAAMINLLRGRHIACGCHSLVRKDAVTWRLVCRNLALLLLCVIAYVGAGSVAGADAIAAVDLSVLVALLCYADVVLVARLTRRLHLVTAMKGGA
ncbi:MAG: MauE/DoxX family redox-associated membrane protein [Mycobacteriales bacterium]|nr:MAG: hypothetical protein DLM56_09935 [Pseudonocardiales bacterium]